MTDERITAFLVERVLHWGVTPDRFVMSGRSWMPRWRFQPAKNLQNAIALLEAADPTECRILRQGRSDWSVMVRVGGNIGNAQESSQEKAITLAVAQALGLDVSACE